MTDIARDQPGDAKQRRIHAQAVTRKGTCGHVAHVSNMTSLKDGRYLCPDCTARVIADLFGEATRCTCPELGETYERSVNPLCGVHGEATQ